MNKPFITDGYDDQFTDIVKVFGLMAVFHMTGMIDNKTFLFIFIAFILFVTVVATYMIVTLWIKTSKVGPAEIRAGESTDE